jgi:DnaJ-class molecular chaperone
MVKCPTCYGHGVGGIDRPKCITCGGSGRDRLADPHGPRPWCTVCGGQGWTEKRVPCGTCKGRGEIEQRS